MQIRAASAYVCVLVGVHLRVDALRAPFLCASGAVGASDSS